MPPQTASTPTAPSASVQPPGASSSPPAGGPPKKFGPAGLGKFKKWLMPALAALVLAGGSVAAYYTVIVPRQPESMLKQAIANTLKKRQTKSTGNLKVEDSQPDSEILKAYDINFSTQSDIDKKVSSMALEFAGADFKLPIEFRMIDGDLYFKLGDAETLNTIAGQMDPDAAAMILAFGAPLADRWIVMEKSLMQQSGTDCLFDGGGWTDSDAEGVAKAYGKNKFAKVTSKSSDTVNGKAATKMTLDIDKDKIDDFSNSLKEVPSLKKLNDCVNKFSQGQGTDDALDSQDGPSSYTLNVWIDNSDKTFSKLELNAQDEKTKVSLQVTFDYSAVNVDKPEGATPLTELLGGLAPLFGGFGEPEMPDNQLDYPGGEL